MGRAVALIGCFCAMGGGVAEATVGVRNYAVNVAGDLRFRVQLTCDQVRTPVVKEESTSFYKQ